ncbi:MAG: DUF1428 domain-containing protein [Bdellovibrionota bacterium]
MSRYLDGYVIPINKSKLKDYKKMANLGRKVWMEHGALDYYECVGAKLDSSGGLSFPKLCKLKPNETVIFAFVVYRSKSHRDRVIAKVHKDPRMQAQNFDKNMPFDMNRFTVGEFETLLHT